MSSPPDAEARLDVERTPCSQSDLSSSSQDAAQSNTEPVPDDHSELEDIESESNESEDGNFDPDGKPSLPYKPGFKFTAFSRELPSPADIHNATMISGKREHELTQSQIGHCLADSVEDAPFDSKTKKELIITSLIRVGSSRGAQLVVVNDDMVAKIYDPLYYNEYEGRWKQDVVKRAHDDYVREAVPYDKLRTSTAAAQITPAFYGAWSTSITTPIDDVNTKDRIVRLILIERLHGQCMRYINPLELRKKVRSKALMKVLDAETVLFEAGIRHCDFHPRNIIMDIPAGLNPAIKVHIVDFGQSEIIKLEGGGKWLTKLKEEYPGRICSPLVRFYGGMMKFSAYGWCSFEDMEAEKWLWRHYKTDKRYFPVRWDPEDPFKEPEYKHLEL